MNRKRTIIRGDSKVEVIYRPVNIPKRGKQNKKAVKEYVVLSREEKQRKISERKKIKAENKRRKKLGENKLRKLIDTEISEAIEAVIDDAESLMPEKMTQSWSREKRIAEGKWLRIEIRKWMHENDCEEIADLKCSPEIISTLALLRVKLKQDYYEASKKYQNHLETQRAKQDAFREEQFKKLRRRSRIDQLKIQKTVSQSHNFADDFEKNHGYD